MKHHEQRDLGRRGFAQLMLPHQRKSGLELKLGRDLEAVAEAEATEGCYILVPVPRVD